MNSEANNYVERSAMGTTYQQLFENGKPVVYYRPMTDREGELPMDYNFIRAGSRAVVMTAGLSSWDKSGDKLILTSRVLEYDKESGKFTTENSVYVPDIR
jgi:hypothetical protein